MSKGLTAGNWRACPGTKKMECGNHGENRKRSKAESNPTRDKVEFTRGTTGEQQTNKTKTERLILKDTKIRQPTFKPAHTNTVPATEASERWRRWGTGR